MRRLRYLSVVTLLCCGTGWAGPQAPPAQPPAAAAIASTPSRSSHGQEYIDAAQAKLQATFTNFKFDEVRESELPGIVEIYAGPRIIYYAPAQEILILGELYSSTGVSLTEQKVGQFAVRKAQDLDKSSALVLGTGETELIAFIDPDCRYCRLAYEWLDEQHLKSIKQYVFFMPMNGRPQAQARALKALCAAPEQRTAALHQVFAASPVQDTAAAEPLCAEAESRLATHAQFATKLGVYATPFFIVKGQVVAGFDRDRLTTLLSEHQTKGDRS